MSKKRIANYVFQPGVSSSSNAYPKAYSLLLANKDFIKKEMKSSKYRMFVISQINEIKINGDVIEIS